MFTLYIFDFLNTARESGKSYMINYVVYVGLNKTFLPHGTKTYFQEIVGISEKQLYLIEVLR